MKTTTYAARYATGLVAGIAAAALWAGAAQAKTEMKLAHFVTAKHSFSKWLEAWAKDVEKKSGGRNQLQDFPRVADGPAAEILRYRPHGPRRSHLVGAWLHARPFSR